MKIKKIIGILVLTILLSGCTTEYNITINDGIITEDINIYANKNDSTENDTFEYYKKNDVISFTDSDSVYVYDKSVLEDDTGLNLKFEYRNLNAYALSSFFNDCFSKSSISSDEEKIYIKASGFTCYSYNYMIVTDASINFSTNHEVLEHNADEVTEGIYKWYPLTGDDLSIILKQNVKDIEENPNEQQNKEEEENQDDTNRAENGTNWLIVGLMLITFVSIIFLLAIYKIKKGQRG